MGILNITRLIESGFCLTNCRQMAGCGTLWVRHRATDASSCQRSPEHLFHLKVRHVLKYQEYTVDNRGARTARRSRAGCTERRRGSAGADLGLGAPYRPTALICTAQRWLSTAERDGDGAVRGLRQGAARHRVWLHLTSGAQLWSARRLHQA